MDVGVAVTNLRVVCKTITCASAFTEMFGPEEVGQDHVRQVMLSQHLGVMENIIEKLLVFGGLSQSSIRLLQKFASVYLVKHL